MQNETTQTTQTTPEIAIQYIEEVQPTNLSAEQTVESSDSAFQLFEKLCNLHREINMLTEDVKQLMQDNKDSLDVSMINTIAKAYVKDKVGDMEEKAETTLSMISNLVK